MKKLHCVLLVFLFAVPAFAQFSSAIQGTVTDATNAAVPDARVTLKNMATGIVREAMTSAEGFYRFSSLGAGAYKISVQKAGFAPATRDSVSVGITEVVRVDVALAVGAVAERVDVLGQVTLVETEQGRVSGRIDQVQVKELPINGRNVYNLIALQPGMTGRGLSPGLYSGGGTDSFAGETQPAAYASGQRWEANNYTVDDTSTNGVARNGATNLTPNTESVEEVRVVANNFSAVDGRNPGGQIQVITKGGTNEFHGSLSWYFTNDTLASRNFNETVLPPIRKNQFGYSVGGPIVRNRTFFFNSFEGLRQSGSRAVSFTVETPEFRNLVTQTRPNSLAAKFLTKFTPVVAPTQNFRDLGSPRAGVNVIGPADGIMDIGTATYAPPSSRAAEQYTLRIDHELRPGKDRLYGSWYETRNATLSPGSIRKDFNTAFSTFTNETTHFGNINHTHTFDATKVNEFRAGIMQLVGRPEPRKFLEFPTLSITSITGFGSSSYPNGWWQTNYHYKDIFSWVRSTHSMKIGGELRHMRGSAQNTNNFIPTYNFNSILDFADDEPLSMNRLVNPLTGEPASVFSQLRQTEWAIFFQDDWKVRRNLTVNLGLRYENYGTFKDKDGRLLRALIFGAGSTYEQRVANGRVDFVDRFYPTDKVNLGPRIGFSWDPFGAGKTSIRGGYGVAFDRLMNLPAENYRSSPPLRAQATLGPQQSPPTTFTYGLGDPSKPFAGYPVDPALRLGLDERGGIRGARTNITTVDPNLESPYVHNWFFGVQREVLRGTVVEANYVGSAGHKLINAVNVNRFVGDFLATGRFRGFNPSFGSISIVQSTSNSNYHAATLVARRQFSKGLLLSGNYTWGKAIDDTDQGVGTTNWQNAYNRKGERALAGFDTRHRAVLIGVWDMPFFKDRNHLPVAHWLFGGWQLSGYAFLISGEPGSVTIGGSWPTGDFNGDGTGGDRPNAPAAGVPLSGWDRSGYMNGMFRATDFPRPASGTDGNMGRNTVAMPGFAQTDLSLAKKFAFTERFNAMLRIDAFNAFNRVNLNNPALDLSSNNFGRSTTARPARFYQVGLRFGF